MPMMPLNELVKGEVRDALRPLAEKYGPLNLADHIIAIVKQANSDPEKLAMHIYNFGAKRRPPAVDEPSSLTPLEPNSTNESRLISRSQIRRIIAEEISKLY